MLYLAIDQHAKQIRRRNMGQRSGSTKRARPRYRGNNARRLAASDCIPMQAFDCVMRDSLSWRQSPYTLAPLSPKLVWGEGLGVRGKKDESKVEGQHGAAFAVDKARKT
jgi:hypothetical protein